MGKKGAVANDDIRRLKALIDVITFSLPCQLCKVHLMKRMARHPVPSNGRREVFEKWGFDLHAAANKNDPNNYEYIEPDYVKEIKKYRTFATDYKKISSRALVNLLIDKIAPLHLVAEAAAEAAAETL
jgi:hypothetical protein